jgi:hypothetical protein
MKRYKKYVYYLTLDHYRRRLNLNILNLETNNITLFAPLRYRNYIQLRKRLGINFLRGIEKTATNSLRRNTGLFNEKSRDIKYRKLVKRIKNYKRDWWKGNMERTIRKLEPRVIFIGGI